MIDVIQDLRPMFESAREQGRRPTCLVFALSDAHAVERRPCDVLSPEHLFFHAAHRMPGWLSHEGVALDAAVDALRLDGQCAETGWPYLNALPADLSNWTPPSTATPLFKRESQTLSSKLHEIIGALDAGRPAILTMLLGERFYTPVNGMVVPGDGDADVDYHAVVAVGHGLLGKERAILIRNSWGKTWGLGGHAWVSGLYLQPRLYQVTMISNKEVLS